MKNKRLFIVLLSATFLLLGASCSTETAEEKARRLRGNAIIETGEIAAVNFKSFPLARYGRQFWEMKIIGILEHGAMVNPGDSIIQLDPTDVKKLIIDWETGLEAQLGALQTMKVNQENQKNDLASRVQNELASFELKKIELEATRFEAERIKKIKELEFKQAEINLAKEMRKVELNQIIAKNDYRIQEIRVNQIKSEIENAYQILPNLTIRTPISGVFQRERNFRTNSFVKEGDEIYVGNNMGSVPELEQMKINTYVNETDFLRLTVGQKVTVRLDAMPELAFDGEIGYIGKLCHLKDQKSRQKVFDVEIKMLTTDARLKPGMTVSCEYLEK